MGKNWAFSTKFSHSVGFLDPETVDFWIFDAKFSNVSPAATFLHGEILKL